MSATLPAAPFLRGEGKIRADMKNRPPVARRVSPWADVIFSALAHGAAWLTLALLAGILAHSWPTSEVALRRKARARSSRRKPTHAGSVSSQDGP